MSVAPCVHCETRYSHCHTECEKYIKFRRDRDRMLEDKLKESNVHPVKKNHY